MSEMYAELFFLKAISGYKFMSPAHEFLQTIDIYGAYEKLHGFFSQVSIISVPTFAVPLFIVL